MFGVADGQSLGRRPLRPQDPPFLACRVDKYFREEERRHVVYGRGSTPHAIQLRTNDYLALGNHPSILRAQSAAIMEHGNGLLMSGVYLDESALQRGFEIRLAEFMDADDCAISQSGYTANVGLIQAIADETTPVYIDMRAHMSLWEGARGAGAPARPFRHNDPHHLERVVRKHGPGIIVVDSIYSTTGSRCPLAAVAEIGEEHGCVLVVDESHALGTHGPRGEGLVVALGLQSKVHFRTASLAKAFAGRGGVVAGSARNIELFRFTAFPSIFSSVVLPHEIAAFKEALRIMKTDGWRRVKLRQNADYLRGRLTDIGYDVSASQSQIIGLEAGPEWRTIQLRDALEAEGIFGAVFCAPATPKNRSMVRLSLNCLVSREELDKVTNVCRRIRDRVQPWAWPAARTTARRTVVASPQKLCA